MWFFIFQWFLKIISGFKRRIYLFPLWRQKTIHRFAENQWFMEYYSGLWNITVVYGILQWFSIVQWFLKVISGFNRRI